MNSPAATSQTIHLPILSAPGSIRIDAFGIPHIKAANRTDLFALQGYNAARERLWQIDLWRKRGLGRLAADFGPGFLEQDKAARMFLYRGPIAAEWAAYGPQSRAIVEAFVAGINAYIDRLDADPSLLPPEFVAMNTRPQRWQAEDVVRIRSHGLTRNALSEVRRAAVFAKGGSPALDLLRCHLDPPIVPTAAEGFDPSAVPGECLDLFRLASANVHFSPQRLAATLAEAPRWRKVAETGEVLPADMVTGSNNWAISGTRSGTGKPLLASDPHREHSVPGLRYLVHLSCPDLDAMGAGEPAIPGLAFGHNGSCGWAVTIFYIDQEDTYHYRLKPDDPNSYAYQGGWEPMTFVDETIAVKGAPDQHVRLAFTRHGPVTHLDTKKGTAVAVRSVWFEPGTAPYMASLRFLDARSVEDFRAASLHWGAPSVNFAYADTGGTIAWMPSGATPERKGWDGLLPVPGDGRYEWQGLRDPNHMPMLVNPPQGYVFSANAMNLPADWDHAAAPIGHEWIERSRHNRISETLAASSTHTLADACRLQNDKLSLPARRLCKLLAPLTGETPDTRAALALLKGWDHVLAPTSAAALLFEVWFAKHLKPALFAALAPDPDLRALLAPGDVGGIVEALERPASVLPARDRLLLDSLASAFADCRDRQGADPTTWQWGRLQHATFEHMLAPVVPQAKDWAVGPLAKGGSFSTPMMAAYRPDTWKVTAGASFRMVLDFADLNRSVCINTPGQSGLPGSPHYSNLAGLWASGAYVPMHCAEASVAADCQTEILLTP